MRLMVVIVAAAHTVVMVTMSDAVQFGVGRQRHQAVSRQGPCQAGKLVIGALLILGLALHIIHHVKVAHLIRVFCTKTLSQ